MYKNENIERKNNTLNKSNSEKNENEKMIGITYNKQTESITDIFFWSTFLMWKLFVFIIVNVSFFTNQKYSYCM